MHKLKKNEHLIDPSAGSPTETLLRLLLPLDNLVCRFYKGSPILKEEIKFSNLLTNSTNR